MGTFSASIAPAKASRCRSLREEHFLYLVEEDGERVAVLRYQDPLGWVWKTATGAGSHARFRRALGEALRAVPSKSERALARERATSHILTGPLPEPSGRCDSPDCHSGLPAGKVSENV